MVPILKKVLKQPGRVWLLVLVLLFVAAVRFHLRDMPLERDEGEYAYAGQMILKGEPPYKQVYNMKLPGTYASYAAIMAVLGPTPSGIRIGVMLVNAASIVLVFLIGRRLLDETVGLVAAVCFGLLSLSPSVYGLAGHATHFLVLPALAGVLFLTWTRGRSEAMTARDRTEAGTPVSEEEPVRATDHRMLPVREQGGAQRVKEAPTGTQPRKTFIAMGKEKGVLRQDAQTAGADSEARSSYAGDPKGSLDGESAGIERGMQTEGGALNTERENSGAGPLVDCAGPAVRSGAVPLTGRAGAPARAVGNLQPRPQDRRLAAVKARSAKEARKDAKLEAGASMRVEFSWWQLAWAGLLMGISFLMKQHGVFFGLFGGIWVVFAQYMAHRERRLVFRRKVLSLRPEDCGPRFPFGVVAAQLWVYGAAFLLPYLLTCLVFWMAGVFPQFWFWTVDYAREYASAMPLVKGISLLKLVFGAIVGPNALLWLLGVAGLAIMWTDHRLGYPYRAFVLLLGLCAVGSVAVGLYFRGHYFIPLLPVIGILAGLAVSRSMWLLRNDRSIELFMAIPVLIALAVGIPLAVIGNGSAWFNSPEGAARETYNTTLFTEATKAAEYLRQNTAPGARVAVIGSEPQIYFLSGRRAATGYIYMYPLMERQPFAAKMQEEMIAEIERNKPDYVVFVEDYFSWLRNEDSHPRLMKWWDAYWDTHLDIVDTRRVVTSTEGDLTELDAKVSGRAMNSQGTTVESDLIVFKRR